jgi:L-ascorbate metabolism protein UlaG (beta-lactamase superfamily)
MQLTKFGHSCVRVDDGDRSLVVDPGVFCAVDDALDGVSNVLLTHEHPDHVDVERVRAAAQRDPRLRIWAPPSVGTSLGDLGEQLVAVSPGETFTVAGFAIRAFGGQHAVIHTSIPVIANVGYLIDDTIYHPGDSFAVPTAPVRTLLVPIHAPWSKVAEVIDFVIAVRARTVHQIHDAMLNDIGLGMVEGHVTRIGAQYGSEYVHLKVGDSVAPA